MTFRNWTLAAALAGAAMLGSPAQAVVTIDYYGSYTDTGSDVSVSGTPFSSATGPSFNFGDTQLSAINTAAGWPGAGASFAAIINGVSAQTGVFALTLGSDDGSYLFINNVLALSNGGSHAYQEVFGNFNINAGDLIRVSYYNSLCCGAAVKLDGAPALTIGAVPEPATWSMMILGFGLVGFALRRRTNVRTTVTYA
jgi:hypothetical protein